MNPWGTWERLGGQERQEGRDAPGRAGAGLPIRAV